MGQNTSLNNTDAHGLQANRCRAVDGRLAAQTKDQSSAAFPLLGMLRIPCRAADHIEFFYNPQRKHVRNRMLSPSDFEQQQNLKLQGV
jgi:hypothetical protein